MNINMKNIIYRLENRAYNYIYHWFFLILAGLRHLENDNEKVNVYMPWCNIQYCNYVEESIEYFKEHFNFIFEIKSSDIQSYEWIDFHGEKLLQADTIDIEGYKYIRNKLLKDKLYIIQPKKYVYITRRGAENLENNNNMVHHAVVNEDKFRNILQKYGFEVIQLEHFNLEEKIRIFRESEIIVAPFGGGLTFTVLCEPTQKVIELVSPFMANDMQHYKVICNTLNIPYIRFTEVETLNNYNIVIDLDKFEECIQTHIQ